MGFVEVNAILNNTDKNKDGFHTSQRGKEKLFRYAIDLYNSKLRRKMHDITHSNLVYVRLSGRISDSSNF